MNMGGVRESRRDQREWERPEWMGSVEVGGPTRVGGVSESGRDK